MRQGNENHDILTEEGLVQSTDVLYETVSNSYRMVFWPGVTQTSLKPHVIQSDNATMLGCCGKITGEVYRVTTDQMNYLDSFLGSEEYQRIRVRVKPIIASAVRNTAAVATSTAAAAAAGSTSIQVAYMYVASERLQANILQDKKYKTVLSGDWCARIERSIEGFEPIVFTAPHTLCLHRDGHPDHKTEDYTAFLARSFALLCDGTCITWTDRERSRVKKLGKPDPANRDPNYLTSEELPNSPWFRALDESMVYIRNQNSYCTLPSANPLFILHVDIHGMSNNYGSDCVIGTGAMQSVTTSEKIAQLQNHIRESLNGLLLGAGFEEIRFNTTKSGKVLSGRIDSGCHNTVTQLSTNASLFEQYGSTVRSAGQPGKRASCAIQMELSYRLRKAMNDSKELRTQFAQSIAQLQSVLIEDAFTV